MSFLLNHLDWVVSFTTLIGIELMIRKRWTAWLFGLLNQAIWLAYILVAEQYGLLPLNIMMCVQNARGLRAWLRNKDTIYGHDTGRADAADG